MKLEILHEDDYSNLSYFEFITNWFELSFTKCGDPSNVRIYFKSIWLKVGRYNFEKEWVYKYPPLTKEKEKRLDEWASKVVKDMFRKELYGNNDKR